MTDPGVPIPFLFEPEDGKVGAFSTDVASFPKTVLLGFGI